MSHYDNMVQHLVWSLQHLLPVVVAAVLHLFH